MHYSYGTMKSNVRPIRVGLIGYGFAGRTFHAPLIRSVEGMTLGVVGSTQLDAVAAAIPEAVVCAPDAVPTHPDVDLVVIATPNQSHFPLAAAALRAGKDVVIDKPFTLDLAEARELAAIAKRHNRLLSVFHNRRWDSEILATQAVLASGVLGQIVHYECHMDRFRPNIRKRWREDPGPGAGLWFDLGPHLIDQALYLFGLPHSVRASFATLRPGGQTEDWAHIQLDYHGLRVILHATLLAAGGAPRTLMHGTRASWMKHGIDTQEQQLIAGMLPTDPAFGIDPNPGILIDGATGQRTEIIAPRGHQQTYYAEIRDALLHKQPPSLSARDAIAVMAILETTFQAATTGTVLPLPLTPSELADWEQTQG